MPVGGLFLSAFIQILFEQLTSGAIMALARQEKVESHFKELHLKLSIIQAVLDDAEEKQLTEKSVGGWLQSLRDWAYDFDDILDEITTQALIQESKGIQHNKTSMVWKLIPTCSSYTPGALVSNYRMMSKIKDINDRLQFLVKQRNELNLRESSGGSSNRLSEMTLPSTSVVNESNVYGRDEDKENVIKLLFGDEACRESVSVIPIVGMGGIGKTTLAQLVYNDDYIKQNFRVRIWVCVSQEFDVISITKTIYDAVIGSSDQSEDDQSRDSTFDMLQVSLKKKLAKTRFLIVLDDVWNEDYGKWDHLFRPFQFGLPGSRIIVTTRNDSVASAVGSPQLAYHMKLLTEKDCLSLLAQRARTSLDETTDFRDVGLGLVRKCKGLPLAAKMLGGILRNKETKREWKDVLNSRIWDLPEANSILAVLRLSYHHLPSHLKHLFAYCSIFPKGYVFDKNELVLLWMGEGFLERPNERIRKEELGLEYFNDLLSRSFFQRQSDSESNFVMHDFINDLAYFVAGGMCYRLDEKMDANQEYSMPEKTRYGSFLCHNYEFFTKFKAFYRAQGLRTFLPMPVQNSLVRPQFYLSNRILVEVVAKLHRLRVLSLSGHSIRELPSLICDLIHLQYLNLSGTSITTLPESVGDLFNLQTLSLRNCRYICKLPPTLGNLSNLRHLDNSNTDQLKDMPVEIVNLRNLRTLPKIVLSKVGGLGLRELRYLKLLRGTLSLLELQNVTDIEDVKEASLRYRNELDELQLTWGRDINDSQDRSPEEEVMELLQPHENLRTLKVEFYGGLKFPSWIGDPAFCKLSSISISSCSGCTFLPPLGQLPDLRHLQVSGMLKVKCIGNEFYGSGVVIPFPKLETLRFDNMPNWEKWAAFSDGEDVQIRFAHLQHLAIFKCGKLTDVSPLNFPVLCKLHIEECSTVLLESFCNLDPLINLKVEAIAGMSHLPSELMQSLAALEVLECCNCNQLLSLWPNEIPPEHLTHLRRLVIADCSQLVSLGQGEQQLPCNLEVLELFRCWNLVSLPNDLSNLRSLREPIIKNPAALTENGSQALSSLERLVIDGCPKLKQLPDLFSCSSSLRKLIILGCETLEFGSQALSSLEHLVIDGCPMLMQPPDFSSLEELIIGGCERLEFFPEMTLPPVFKRLVIQRCKLVKSLPPKLFNSQGTGPESLEFYGCPSLESLSQSKLPETLRFLSVRNCSSLKSLPRELNHENTSLNSLQIWECESLQDFPHEGLPCKITSLSVMNCRNLKPLSEWGLKELACLRNFSFGGCPDIADFVGGMLSDSVCSVLLKGLLEVVSIAGLLSNLNSLDILTIRDCPRLERLAEVKLPDSVRFLHVSNCPMLRARCGREQGEEWPKIAHIPLTEFDFQPMH